MASILSPRLDWDFLLPVRGIFPAERKREEEDQGNGESGKTRRLGTREEAEDLFRIIAAQEFEAEAGGTVEHDVEREALSFGMVCRAEQEQQCEDDDIELSFPDLSRPEGLTAVDMVCQCRIRVDDAE